MKKIIIAVILTAVLGIAGVAAASIIAGQAEEKLSVDTELKCGIYYFNGDKNSDLWLEVNPEFLILKGKDVNRSLETAVAKINGVDLNSNPDPEVAMRIMREIDECKTLYCTEKIYIVEPFLPEQSKSLICVSRFNTESTPEELRNSNAAFTYNYAERSINLALFGDFILAP